MDKEAINETVKQIAWIAWKGAANAYRMYPDNSHTFSDYWGAAKEQFLEHQKAMESYSIENEELLKAFETNKEQFMELATHATDLQFQITEQQRTIDELRDFLKDHEQWEADFISENSMWWPNREEDALNGKLYEDFLKLQEKRNKLIKVDVG